MDCVDNLLGHRLYDPHPRSCQRANATANNGSQTPRRWADEKAAIRRGHQAGSLGVGGLYQGVVCPYGRAEHLGVQALHMEKRAKDTSQCSHSMRHRRGKPADAVQLCVCLDGCVCARA